MKLDTLQLSVTLSFVWIGTTVRAKETMEPLQWIPLPMTAAPQALGGQRVSQIVYEYAVKTPTKQHEEVTMERTSTGGTQRPAQFVRAAGGPMSGAERAEKKRKRATLFPQKQAAVRKKDVQRKRQVAAAKLSAAATAAAEQASLAQQQQYWDERLEEEYWSSLPTPYYTLRCCGFRMEWPALHRHFCRPATPHPQTGYVSRPQMPCQGCGQFIDWTALLLCGAAKAS